MYHFTYSFFTQQVYAQSDIVNSVHLSQFDIWIKGTISTPFPERQLKDLC